MPWLPTVIVGLYGAYVLLAVKAARSTSAVTVDSPYLLGFLLTEVSLYAVFMNLGENWGKEGFDIRFLIGGVGTAVLTTVVGLVFRQAGASYLVDESSDDFQGVLKEIKDNAVVFGLAQRNFVQMLNEHTVRHSELLSQERRAVEQYTTSLTDSRDRLTKSLTGHATLISTSFEEIGKALVTFRTSVENEAGHLGRAGDALESLATQRIRALEEVLGAGVETLAQLRKHHEEIAKTLRAAVSEQLDSVKNATAIWTSFAKDAGQGIDTVTSSLRGTAAAGTALQKELGSTGDALVQLRKQFAELPAPLSQSVKKLSDEFDKTHAESVVRLNELAKEANAIDLIIDDLIRSLRTSLQGVPAGR